MRLARRNVRAGELLCIIPLCFILCIEDTAEKAVSSVFKPVSVLLAVSLLLRAVDTMKYRKPEMCSNGCPLAWRLSLIVCRERYLRSIFTEGKIMRMIKIVLSLLIVSCLCAAGAVWAQGGSEEEKRPAKKAILAVSFGTSVPNAEKAITNLVDAAKKSFPDYEVRLAYTSNIIRRKIAAERKINIPAPLEALAKLNDDGFTDVLVATTLIIPGEEYNGVKSLVDGLSGIEGKYGFEKIELAQPLLATIPRCEQLADALVKRFSKELSEKDTAIVLMGHGSPEHFSHALYSQLQLFLNIKAPSRFFVGTVEVAPLIGDIVYTLKTTGNKKVVLSPLMIVAGDHAINDMADPDDRDSWLSALKTAGYKDIKVRQQGLGEDPLIAELFIQSIKELAR